MTQVVTVRLFGGVSLPVATQVLEIEVDSGTSVGDLLRLLEERLGEKGLKEKIDEHCLVAVDGTEIGHLAGMATILGPDSVVSVVPAMVGG